MEMVNKTINVSYASYTAIPTCLGRLDVFIWLKCNVIARLQDFNAKYMPEAYHSVIYEDICLGSSILHKGLVCTSCKSSAGIHPAALRRRPETYVLT